VTALLQLAPNSIFAGEYRVVRLLNEGGMGAVYVVEQASTGKQRALKIMHPQLVTNEKMRQRFEQEARIGGKIESDHVVQVLGAGIESRTGTPWLVMELLKGQTLGQLLAQKGVLPVPVVREVFTQLCHALGAAHRAGIVHRDLKPENIFLEVPKREGVEFTLKILDFGIAKMVAEAGTQHTAAIGTPLWMAPEQTESRAVIGPQADVWALGLIAFHLLTGRLYWREANLEGGSSVVLMREIVIDPLVAASVSPACG
jgi:eukaryotic-like serine/threonine-protein kinase